MVNSIAELTGNRFLLFYAVVILATLVSCWWRASFGTLFSRSVSPRLPSLSLKANKEEIRNDQFRRISRCQ